MTDADLVERAIDELIHAEGAPFFPPQTRFRFLKVWLLRMLRIYSRKQDMFNRATVGALSQMARHTAAQGQHLAEVRTALQALEQHISTVVSGPRQQIQHVAAVVSSQSPVVDFSPFPGLYLAFENQFRGSPELIRERQAQYVDLIRDALNRSGPGPVLDIGCGRGEFLDLLRAEQIPAEGIDRDPSMVGVCRQRGLNVMERDALRFLASSEDDRWAAVVAFHVVEHLPPNHLLTLFRLLSRKVRAGGLVVLETVNPGTLAGLQNFFVDPTHWRPLPAPLLAFLLEQAGFESVKTLYLHPVPEAHRLQDVDSDTARLNHLLFGAQDYAIVGYRGTDAPRLGTAALVSDVPGESPQEGTNEQAPAQSDGGQTQFGLFVPLSESALASADSTYIRTDIRDEKTPTGDGSRGRAPNVQRLETLLRNAQAQFEEFETQLHETRDRLAEMEAKANELRAQSHHWRSVAEGLKKELECVYASRSWRVIGSLRRSKDQLLAWVRGLQRGFFPSKDTIKRSVKVLSVKLLHKAAAHPRLKGLGLRIMRPFPKLEARLRRMVVHDTGVTASSPPQPASRNPRDLSEEAQRVYKDLMAALNGREAPE